MRSDQASGRAGTDAGVQCLREHPNLKTVDITNQPITGAGLSVVPTLPMLQELRCDPKERADEGLALIGQCRTLRVLGLEYSGITDDGLKSLAGMTELEDLAFHYTQLRGDLAAMMGICRCDGAGQHRWRSDRMWPEHQRVRYRGPAISSHQAARIAQEFVREHKLPIRRLSRAVHCRPIVYGREDDKLSGTWEVWFESSVPPLPPGQGSDPSPDHPIIVYVDDQTGAATLHQWM